MVVVVRCVHRLEEGARGREDRQEESKGKKRKKTKREKTTKALACLLPSVVCCLPCLVFRFESFRRFGWWVLGYSLLFCWLVGCGRLRLSSCLLSSSSPLALRPPPFHAPPFLKRPSPASCPSCFMHAFLLVVSPAHTIGTIGLILCPPPIRFPSHIPLPLQTCSTLA